MAKFHASPAAAHEVLRACRLLFRDGAERTRERLLAAREPTGLFVARDAGGRPRAAALVQALPGALGVAWPTRGDSREAEDAATAAACAWMRERGVKVCQAFAPADEAADMAALARGGFRHTTQLVFLRREVRYAHDRLRPNDWLDGCHYLPALRNEFRATLLATHDGTLDCPELNGSRDPDELVAGFGLLDERGSAWQFLAESNGRPVGLLLMQPEGASLEIAYLGVIAAERGRGFGDKLVRLARDHAACAHFEFVSLSVDARNAPAMRLYARHGFAEYDRREVWLKQFPISRL